MRVDKEIESISDALKAALDAQAEWRNVSDGYLGLPYNFPFGIWYRGQVSHSFELEPSVFRAQGGKYYNEVSLFYHFQLRSPQYRRDHFSPFEWLSLMQHHGAPTRLLDWSESVLVGLYFATMLQRDDDDGELFVLNARKLNEDADVGHVGDGAGSKHGSKYSSIHVPHSFNVVLRALIAADTWLPDAFGAQLLDPCEETDAPSKGTLQAVREYLNDDPGLQAEPADSLVAGFIEQLRKPVAVFPFRANPRLLTQQGTFTIHGGRRFGVAPGVERFAPIAMDKDADYLRVYRIPKNAKAAIQGELAAAGIHEGSLFPELDHQAQYMKRLWLTEPPTAVLGMP